MGNDKSTSVFVCTIARFCTNQRLSYTTTQRSYTSATPTYIPRLRTQVRPAFVGRRRGGRHRTTELCVVRTHSAPVCDCVILSECVSFLLWPVANRSLLLLRARPAYARNARFGSTNSSRAWSYTRSPRRSRLTNLSSSPFIRDEDARFELRRRKISQLTALAQDRSAEFLQTKASPGRAPRYLQSI